MTTWPIAPADVEAARERLRPHLPKTPLRIYAALDEVLGAGIRVFVKHETVGIVLSGAHIDRSTLTRVLTGGL